ncbi:titin isoform X10 [Astyanax mexicanus]|uniref:titin isoform X10 n=1 Tax=Astyanax mexicanus TaxID=7994 RepID=UPI0020CB5323|nr:titin isoform X10 [Astyanax mexicanus]
MVTVSSGGQTKPSSIFAVSSCGASSDGFQTLGCVTSGFSPAESLTFSWTGDVTGKVDYPAMKSSDAYTAVSQVQVKNSDWEAKKSFTCKATNQAGSLESKPIQFLREPAVDPNITLLAKVDDNTIQLLCLVDGFVPKKHQEVKWLKNKSPFSGSPVTRTLEAKGKRIFTQISEIHIDAQQLNDYSEYTCEASQNISSTWSSCKARPVLRPLINVKKPRLAAAKDGLEQITATCSVEAEPNTKVSWASTENREMESDTKMTSDNSGSKTQLITSTLTLNALDWEKNLKVKCRVIQPCNNIHEETVIILDVPVKTPTVEIRRPLEGDNAVLECSARDLPSGEVSVTFLTNTGHQFPEVTYVDLPRGQSTLITRFTIPTSHQKKEHSFKCKVQQSPSRDWQSGFTGNIFGEPSVELLMVPNTGKTDQTLVCYGTGLNPTITWKPTSVGTAKTVMQAADGRVKVSSQIIVRQLKWNEGEEYTCQVTDLRKSVQKSISVCTASEPITPLINLRKPRLAAAKQGSEQITATCSVEAAPNTKVSWVLNGNGKEGNTKPPVDKPGSKTQIITSTLTLKASEWEKHQNVQCRVKQPCSSEQQETVNILEPVVKTPTVEIIRPLADVLKGDYAVLECSARDLPSGEVSVTILTNTGHQFPEVTYVDLPRGQSTLITRFTIPTTHRKKEHSFTCKVQQSPSKLWQSTSTGYIFEPAVDPNITLLAKVDDNTVKLLCLLDGFVPKKHQEVKWLKNKSPFSGSPVTRTLEAAGKRIFTQISEIHIDAQQLNDYSEYTCQASQDISSTWSSCKARPLLRPLINVKKPRLAAAKQGSEQISATCSVEVEPNTKVSWVSTDNREMTSDIKMTSDNRGSKTQLTTSTLTLKASDWEKNLKVKCRVLQPCNNIHEETVIILEPVVKIPTVEIRRPLEGDSAVLECSARDLPSGEVSVTFLTNTGHQFPEVTYVDLPRGQSTLITRFTIPTTHRRKEYSFKCKVQQSPSRVWQSTSTGNIFGESSVELSVVPRNPDSEAQTLQCYGTGFNPKITWLAGSTEKNAVAQETTMQADGRVKVSSYVTVPLDEWREGVVYTCKINDFSTVWKSISDCKVGEHLAQPPQQYLWGPSFTVMKSDGRAPVTCLVIAHKVKDFTITWRVENRVTSQDVIQEFPRNHNNGSQSVQSVLMLSEQLWDKYDVSCEVKHRCMKKAQYVNISKIRDPKRPTVQVFKPSDSDFSDSHDSTLLCLITGFYPADISVHWGLNGRKLPASRWNNSPLGSHSSGREFSMHSALTLPESEREHGTFSCIVEHQSSPNPIISTVDSIHASVINSVPAVELMQARDELVCLVYDYSPSVINITWLLDGVKVPHKHTTRPAKGPDGKFSVKSQLHVLASEWAPGSKYTCLVQHVTGSSTQNISKEEIIEQNIYYNENLSDAIIEDTAEETWNMACAFIVLFLLSLIYGCSVTLVKVNTARPARPFHSRDFK